jgi:hypothetical protein
MKCLSLANGRVARIPPMTAAASLLAALLLPAAASAQTETPPSAQPTPGPTPAQPPSEAELKAWRKSIARVPAPKKGCFTSSYPSTEWQEVPCVTPPERPYPPRPQTVGGGTDFSAQVTGQIISATGSFDSVIGVTSETGTTTAPPPAPACSSPTPNVPNTFALQVNANKFTTSVCPNPQCGWQRFIYTNSQCGGGTACAFIQYWLLNPGSSCPSGWTQFQNGTQLQCFQNAPSAAGVPSPQQITNLGQLELTGGVSATGDTATIAVGTKAYSTAPNSDVLNLAQGQSWQVAEFNLVGDGCGSQAVFQGAPTIVVRTSVLTGSANAPNISPQAFTAETNNLTLVPPQCASAFLPPFQFPAIVFTETAATWLDTDFTKPPINAKPATAGGHLDGYWDGSAQHVNFIDGNQHVHELYNGPLTSGTWLDTDFTKPPINAQPAISGSALDGYWDGSAQHVNFIASNGDVHELYNGPLTSGTWLDIDLTRTATNGTAAGGGSALDGYWDGSAQHVNFIAGNGDVHELYNGPLTSGTWLDIDLTRTATNGTAAGGGSALDGYWDGSAQHVNFIDGSNHVHELYNGPLTSGTWLDTDFTKPPINATTAISGGALDGYWDGGGQHVNFIGSNGDVHELYNGPFSSGTWLDTDLTLNATNGTAAAAGSTLDGYWDGSGQHVNFIGSNGDVHELYNGPFSCSPWSDTDLTQSATNGVPPGAGSVLDGYWDGSGEHVNFIGSNGDVHELYSFRPSK